MAKPNNSVIEVFGDDARSIINCISEELEKEKVAEYTKIVNIGGESLHIRIDLIRITSRYSDNLYCIKKIIKKILRDWKLKGVPIISINTNVD